MASGMPDSSPSSKSKRGSGGMKNVDGREGGQGWDKQSSPFGGQGVSNFADKSVDSMPNEGVPTLGSKGVIGKVIE